MALIAGQPDGRDRRLITAILVLAVVALFFVVIGQLATAFFYFGDVLLTFFLAWLLAFIISPIVARVVNFIPRLPRGLATILVYTVVVGLLVVILVLAAGALANSIVQFAEQIPDIKANLPQILAPWQGRLNAIGLSQVDLVAQAEAALGNLDQIAAALVSPLQEIAVASLSVIGTTLIVFFLSIYMVVDRDQVLAFLFRLVPPSYAEEARLLQTSVSKSFGGFLRGQSLMGVVYFFIALGTSLALGLPLAALTSVASGVLQMIPFFGPFVSWMPPVVVALVLKPDVALPTLILMIAGWIVVMNVLQPRIMQGAVGIHPIVVLGSVLIGSRVAGIPGAIFAIPIAAVVSAFFFQFLHRASGDRTVTGRAAKRLQEREGRPVHVPRETTPGTASELGTPPALAALIASFNAYRGLVPISP
jgi:predicted PurR-regulated permease PerM